MNFVKNNFFRLGQRRFKIISGIVFVPEFPDSTGKHDVGNACEFIEVVKDTEGGETFWREVEPTLIANPVEDWEVYCNDWAKMEHTLIRPNTMLYDLISKGKIILE